MWSSWWVMMIGLNNNLVPIAHQVLNQRWQVHRRIYASSDHNELIFSGGKAPLRLMFRALACWARIHDDAIKWKHFPRYWPFVRWIHRSPVNSPHKGQWRGALMFSLICFWIDGWVNNGEAGDLRRYCAHYDVTVMLRIHVSVTSANEGSVE